MSTRRHHVQPCRSIALARAGLVLGLAAAVAVLSAGCATERVDPDAAGTSTEAGAKAPQVADWCAAHGLPESKCTKCNPELIAGFQAAGDWCAEHGFPESACPFCNPAPSAEAPQVADWCAAHGLPESKCTKCNPELIAGFQAAGDWCAEHGFPESACPFCSGTATPSGADSGAAIVPGTRIRFKSPEIERASGLAVDSARAAALEAGIACNGRIEFDRNRLADIRSPYPGIVRDVLVDLGERVARGAGLFVLESPEVADLQGSLRAARERVEAARAQFERQRELRESRIASARQLEAAREDLESREAELRSLEAGLRIAGAIEAGAEGRFRLTAPIAGTVVRREATRGTFATSDVSLATVADTSTMWALLEMLEASAGSVRVGQSVVVEVDGLPGRSFAGTVTWIASEVDPRTRTVEARAEIANHDGALRAGQFVRATIRAEAAEGAVAVPRRAVQRVGDDAVVFVRIGNGLYEPRIVTLGRAGPDLVEVVGAVRAGDPVVTDGAFLLRTELSRESIGAGCCEVEPPGGS